MTRAYILLLTDPGTSGAVVEEAARIPGVTSALPVTGPYDVVLEVEARSVSDINRRVLPQVQRVQGVARTLTCPVIRLS